MERILRAELDSIEAKQVRWEQRDVYARFLAQTYYYVCHSTRLLGLAAARVSVERASLHSRLLKHAAEERGHHILAERDLTALGFQLSKMPELPSTGALYQTQYYQIEHISPLALLGYVLALEGIAVAHGPHVYERVSQAHGEPSCGFVRLHAQEDPDHLTKAFEEISALSEGECEIVLRNMRFSCALYRAFLRDLVDPS
jgi:hypothetical protein